MHFRSWQSDDPLAPGEYGIEMPQAKSPIIEADHLAIVLVPLVAFDQAGTRLGAGGGYYDRYLANLDPSTPRVGIGFNCQLAEQTLPSVAWDVRLTHALTEVSAFEFSAR
jgi:5-formyltetrahydrofolate cyclo-ligase